METEFIVLTLALVIASALCIYCGVKFVIYFVAWRRLRAIRQNIPNSKNNIPQKPCDQKANSYARGKRVQYSPVSISVNNPNNDTDEDGDKYTIPYPLSYILVCHIVSIIKRIATKCKQNLLL